MTIRVDLDDLASGIVEAVIEMAEKKGLKLNPKEAPAAEAELEEVISDWINSYMDGLPE